MQLTPNELVFVNKLADLYLFKIKRLSGKEQSVKEVNACTKLRIAGPVVELSRVENKLLQRMINDRIANDRNVTLPAYDKRVTDYPQDAARYQPYIERLESDIATLEELLVKVQAAL